MAVLGGAALMLKSMLGQETFDQIQGLATDGTLQKIVTFADNSERLSETLSRLEQKLDDFIATFEPVPDSSACQLDRAAAAGPVEASGPKLEPGSGPGQSGAVIEPSANGAGMSESDGAASGL